MKPTQNNKGNKKSKPVWQEPDPGSAQKFITPEAEKSMREGAGRYRVVRSATSEKAKPTVQRRTRGAKKQSFGEAIRDEIKERLSALGHGVSVNSEDIIKVCIIAGFMIVFALLQTTFFVRFSPFGAVPDIMLALTAAVAQNEDEKWGGVCGLAAALVINSLGGVGSVPHLLPLLYMPVGYVIGILSGYYFSSSLPVKAMYIAGCGVCKMIFTFITASLALGASAAQILADIVIPEFFSTAIVAPAVYFLVYMGLRHFHKSRAERTEGRSQM